MAADEKIFAHSMTDNDKLLAEIAQIIVGAHNGSYKPHLIPKEKEVAPPYYRWVHSPEGYSLISSNTQDFEHPQILTTDGEIADFIGHVFLILAGDPSIKWDNIMESKAVSEELEKYFSKSEVHDIKIELSNKNHNNYFDDKPAEQKSPTIWATVKIGDQKDVWEKMDMMGFTYFDRNLWEIQL